MPFVVLGGAEHDFTWGVRAVHQEAIDVMTVSGVDLETTLVGRPALTFAERQQCPSSKGRPDDGQRFTGHHRVGEVAALLRRDR